MHLTALGQNQKHLFGLVGLSDVGVLLNTLKHPPLLQGLSSVTEEPDVPSHMERGLK